MLIDIMSIKYDLLIFTTVFKEEQEFMCILLSVFFFMQSVR